METYELEQEMDNFLNEEEEVNLEPNIVESFDDIGETVDFMDDEPMEDTLDLEEDFAEAVDADESFYEGNRREKANQRRSKQNQKRSITNKKNIIRLGRAVNRDRKALSIHKKRNRSFMIRVNRDRRRFRIDIARAKRAIRVYGKRTKENSRVLEILTLVSGARLVSGIANQFAPNAQPALKAIGLAAPEIAAILGANTAVNKWALLAGSGLVAASPLASLISTNGNKNGAALVGQLQTGSAKSTTTAKTK